MPPDTFTHLLTQPLVDLFAVLAIVFMIHSNEEITAAQTENDERIHEIVAEVQEARNTLEAIDELERARRKRRELMANAASKSLEQIREERERQAQELLAQVTEMLATQQSSAAAEYENILGVCAAEAQAAGQDGSGVCGDVADWGHDGLGRGVADESGWLGGRREGRAGVPRSFHRRDGVGHGALRRPGGCAAA